MGVHFDVTAIVGEAPPLNLQSQYLKISLPLFVIRRWCEEESKAIVRDCQTWNDLQGFDFWFPSPPIGLRWPNHQSVSMYSKQCLQIFLEKANRHSHEWAFCLIKWTTVYYSAILNQADSVSASCEDKVAASDQLAILKKQSQGNNIETVWACYRGRYCCLEFSWRQIDIYYEYLEQNRLSVPCQIFSF